MLKIEVEYALHGIEKPVGVADYILTKRLPKPFKGKLPTARELEKHIAKD